jgi:hypothetical protein
LTHYGLLDHFYFQLRGKLLFSKQRFQIEADKWYNFLDILDVARPEYSSLSVDDVSGGWLGITDIHNNTPRLDVAHSSEHGIEVSRAAHALAVALIPDYLDLVDYRRNTRGIVTVDGGVFMLPALISIRMLRKKKCQLPVKVFVSEEKDYLSYICDTGL